MSTPDLPGPASTGLTYDQIAVGAAVTSLATLLPWLYAWSTVGAPAEMPGVVATALAGILVAMWRGILVVIRPAPTPPPLTGSGGAP